MIDHLSGHREGQVEKKRTNKILSQKLIIFCWKEGKIKTGAYRMKKINLLFVNVAPDFSLKSVYISISLQHIIKRVSNYPLF